jgi:histidinol-phosphate aminotransferase
MNFVDLVNPHIRTLKPYQPGKPIEELERELGIRGSIKLASNENPLGPSPKAIEAMRTAIDDVNRYPDGASFALRRALAVRLGVQENQLVFGCGGDEILELVAKTVIAPGSEVVYAWPSFAMYPIVIQGSGAVGVPVPLTSDFVHDLDAMAAAVTDQTRAVFVCNPNNPSGTTVGAAEFDRFVSALPDHVVLVIDEAYFEFVRRSDFPDVISLISRRPGTLALRTFSKIYGLAGMRIGYGICDEAFASYLERARHPFNVNRMAEIAALAALDDEAHVTRTLEVNEIGIEYLTAELGKMGIETWPSDANFILAKTGADVFDALLRKGVIVRPMHGFGLTEHVRISIGLPEENKRLIEALTEIRAAKEGAA